MPYHQPSLSLLWNGNLSFVWKVSYVTCCLLGHTGKDSGWRSTDMIPQTVGDKQRALVWSALPATLCLQHTCIGSPYTALLISPRALIGTWWRQRETRQRTEAACCFHSLTSGQLLSLAVSSGLNYSCWFMSVVCLLRGLTGLQLLSYIWCLIWDWTPAKEAHPQRTIA